MDNLLASTDVGTIFLDRELAHPQVHAADRARRSISCRTTLAGRSRLHAQPRPSGPDGRPRSSVLASGSPIEREIRDAQGSWFFLRILPYRAQRQPSTASCSR